MTNEMIVLSESVKLMEAGIIGTTGRTFKMMVVENGEEVEKEFAEPEPIHTYNGWKQRVYQVQKGEKAIAQFTIWKHVTKKGEMQGKNKEGEIITEEYDDSRMFMKKASWFKFSQVAPIEQ